MKNKILAILVAAVLLISVLSVGVFAADETDNTAETAATEETVSTEETAATEETASTEETSATEGTESTTTTGFPLSATESTTETTTTVAPTTGSTDDTTPSSKSWFEKNSGLVIVLAVLVGLVIIFFVIWFASPKFREKFKKFWKDYNAEFKKLVWPTKQQLARNSAVVLVTIIVSSALLALLDLGFQKGIDAIRELVKLIWPM